MLKEQRCPRPRLLTAVQHAIGQCFCRGRENGVCRKLGKEGRQRLSPLFCLEGQLAFSPNLSGACELGVCEEAKTWHRR